jgi:hypothetical protein
MIYLGLWLLVLGVSAAQAASIIQQTEGWCSPAVGRTVGNVTITMNCQGVDPKALDALNRDLGLTKGQLRLTNQQLEQKTKEADEWARKYRELSQQAEAIQDNKLTAQAKALLSEGKLEEADTLLKRSAISMAQYHAIQTGPETGMSYPEVVKVLGRPGAAWLDWLHRRRGGGSVFLADYVEGDFLVIATFVGTVVEGELIIYRTRAVDTSGDSSEFPAFADAPVLMERHAQYAADARRTHAEVFAQVKAERG